MRKQTRTKVKTLLLYLALVAVTAAVLFPLVWMLSTSLKTEPETFRLPPTWIPRQPTVQSFVTIWKLKNFARYFLNTAVVAVAATGLSLLLSVPASYAFARFRFRGARLLLSLILVTQMLPSILLVIPYFSLMRVLGLLNTHLALILAYASFSLPFCTWMLRGFFATIPKELDEAAMVDGCSRLQAVVRVVVPLAVPGLGATSLFTFLLAWNHYLFSLALATNDNMYTVSVGLGAMMGEFRIAWNELMAAALVATIPTLIVYSFLERYFVQGLTGGAVKG
ncbi:MAG: carbohydrate ABC transporter permease [Methanocella sp.]